MKYSDLIQFEPIETVVQLRKPTPSQMRADCRDVGHLRPHGRVAHRAGVSPIAVQQARGQQRHSRCGNYGTGKSHLMAVVSAIAEHQDLASHLTNQKVARQAADIGGRFRVIRAEIGSTTMSLRDIVCSVLEDGLDGLGVTY